MKYTGNLSKDIFEGFSETLADLRIQELETMVEVSASEKSKLASTLNSMTLEHYKHGPSFKKMKNSNQVRDYLITFGRHWLSGICKREYPHLYCKISSQFKNGLF